MLLKSLLKVTETPTSVLNIRTIILNCQRLLGPFHRFLNVAENILKGAREIYKCLKLSYKKRFPTLRQSTTFRMG